MSDDRSNTEHPGRNVCVVCRRPAHSLCSDSAVRLRDGAYLCGICTGKIRYLYPMTTERGNREDPLGRLTSGEAIAAAMQTSEKLYDRRRQCSLYNAVFRVDSFNTESRGLFKAPQNVFAGCVLCGTFHIGERVKLLHNNAAVEFVLDDIKDACTGGPPGDAGNSRSLYTSWKGLSVRSGDLIVKD